MPLRDHEVDTTIPFDPDERLFRRFLPSEIVDGEITPASLNSMGFEKLEQGAPSVVREHFGTIWDTLHPDCGGNTAKDFEVFSVQVRNVPKGVKSTDGKEFDFFPRHAPMPACGAHSVISCCSAGDVSQTYTKPPSSARNDFRQKLARFFKQELLPLANPTDNPAQQTNH